MKTEIPEFLIEMSKQIREQDNRSTAHPIYQVRCKRFLVTEEGYNESHWELHDRDSEGHPTYSTQEGFDNSDAHLEFYENNKEWCRDWLEHNDHEESFESFVEHFDFVKNSSKWFDWPSDCNAIFLQETEEVIRSCLTEADANTFIARKQHDYPKLYTYADSMVFCPQMMRLRNWIIGLTDYNGKRVDS